MYFLRLILVLSLGLIISACGSQSKNKGNATAIDAAANTATLSVVPGDTYSVRKVVIRVPETLVVSEENRYYPEGDIVWRGDPPGDRHAQVKAIFEVGIGRGAAAMKGKTKVDIDIEVMRFHALTEKARYSVGGLHAITFAITLMDPKTGEPIRPSRIVQADLDGYGGDEAIAADAAGLTQKFRITNHLANVIVIELSTPEGYQNGDFGIIQTLNKY
jgi:hypothetical protein